MEPGSGLKPEPEPEPEPEPVPELVPPRTEPPELKHDFFLSHYQATGGDQVATLELRLQQKGFSCWVVQMAEEIT